MCVFTSQINFRHHPGQQRGLHHRPTRLQRSLCNLSSVVCQDAKDEEEPAYAVLYRQTDWQTDRYPPQIVCARGGHKKCLRDGPQKRNNTLGVEGGSIVQLVRGNVVITADEWMMIIPSYTLKGMRNQQTDGWMSISGRGWPLFLGMWAIHACRRWGINYSDDGSCHDVGVKGIEIENLIDKVINLQQNCRRSWNASSRI